MYSTFSVLQSKRNSTKTRNRRDLSNEGRKFMMMGPLKWESDLYFFIRAMFNEVISLSNFRSTKTLSETAATQHRTD